MRSVIPPLISRYKIQSLTNRAYYIFPRESTEDDGIFPFPCDVARHTRKCIADKGEYLQGVTRGDKENEICERGEQALGSLAG